MIFHQFQLRPLRALRDAARRLPPLPAPSDGGSDAGAAWSDTGAADRDDPAAQALPATLFDCSSARHA